jgi:hypothetical protein
VNVTFVNQCCKSYWIDSIAIHHPEEHGMPTMRSRRTWITRATALSVGFVAAAATLAAPAQADQSSDAFLGALNSAGVNNLDPNIASSLGQTICPMLSKPGGSFAKTASQVRGDTGLTPDMAGMFTSIAISMYCPTMMTQFANGDFSGLGAIPGLGSFLSVPGL